MDGGARPTARGSRARGPPLVLQRQHRAAPAPVSKTKYSRYVQAVHKKIDAINEAMWAAIQEGTVAVHCLAGIHRAACIMACHFLYRYYVLGHADVPHDKADIYKKMMSVRPHVRPAYEDILNSYEKYLQRKTRR